MSQDDKLINYLTKLFNLTKSNKRRSSKVNLQGFYRLGTRASNLKSLENFYLLKSRNEQHRRLMFWSLFEGKVVIDIGSRQSVFFFKETCYQKI